MPLELEQSTKNSLSFLIGGFMLRHHSLVSQFSYKTLWVKGPEFQVYIFSRRYLEVSDSLHAMNFRFCCLLKCK